MWQTYVAFGDSVTAGVGDSVAGIEMRSWAEWVAKALMPLNPALTYTNLARAGSTTASVLREQLPNVLNIHPDLVSITIGANDARLPKWRAEIFRQEFKQVVQPLVNQGTTIITMAYPDWRPALKQERNEIPRSWQLYFRRMKETNAVIRQVSEQFNACLLDFESVAQAQDSAHISSDLIHPNALGHKQAADWALRMLMKRFDLPLSPHL